MTAQKTNQKRRTFLQVLFGAPVAAAMPDLPVVKTPLVQQALVGKIYSHPVMPFEIGSGFYFVTRSEAPIGGIDEALFDASPSEAKDRIYEVKS